jgi:feruloyl esterase
MKIPLQATFLAAALLLRAAPLLAQTPCEQLAAQRLPNVTITLATSVAPGPFQSPAAPAPGPPQARGGPTGPVVLPAHCRVAATLKPSPDSDVEMELWLPAAWNGKFQAVGNGGFAGSITYTARGAGAVASSMADALQQGYATASTDTGHKSPGGSFAYQHPEKFADFAWRAVHEMTVQSKALIQAFYGKAPTLSYWNSCSNGGRAGLMEAQRFPADFDGILAGSPVLNWTGRAVQALWVSRAVHESDASFIPPAKFPALHKAAVEKCDALDGVKDGILENPTRCQFDPAALLCKSDDNPSCLTASQVEAARKIYTAASNPKTGQEFYPGLVPGSELGWGTYASPNPFGVAVDQFKYVVFEDPNWDYKKLDFDGDIARARRAGENSVDALNPNLKEFFARGGKLIQYHGWNDPQILALNSVQYYVSVLDAMGGAGKVSGNYRLFMVPGMAHCGGGEGPNRFEGFAALTNWVENKQAPDQILASRFVDGKVDRTRPLCPYPQTAVYKGAGSTDDAASFVCALPKQ